MMGLLGTKKIIYHSALLIQSKRGVQTVVDTVIVVTST